MKKLTALFAGMAIALAAPTMALAAGYTTAVTTIGTLKADPAAHAIVEKHLPGLLDNPQMDMAAGMTFRAIQPMAGDKVPEEALNKIDADLAKLPAKK
ncbi:hypothetical protein [Sphingomonas solaris]|uniref:Uncharacterized protein n=1 Tax=Alterirhizorhabdus solaris TaxID=2529389 RepID=A0A558RB68_9SPHN|nr:hypothetical protein [Sphingomonas solaris]TVV76614.1 hypothetical protein FOY91_03540 [Sphingomonas solaris]